MKPLWRPGCGVELETTTTPPPEGPTAGTPAAIRPLPPR